MIHPDSLDNERLEATKAAKNALARERRILIFGNDKSGKSTIAAQLMGAPALAETHFETPYISWRHSCADGNRENSRFVARDEIDGLEIIDTQSLHQDSVVEALALKLPQADLILPAIDCRKAKNNIVWEALANIPQNILQEKTILVACFADDENEHKVIQREIAKLCQEKLGYILPIILVSPQVPSCRANLIRRAQDILDGPHGIVADLHHLTQELIQLLKHQESDLQLRSLRLRTNTGFLDTVEQEINNILKQQLSTLDQLLEQYLEANDEQSPILQKSIQGIFGYILSPLLLFKVEKLGAKTEKKYFSLYRQEIEQKQERTDEQFISLSQQHWKDVRPRMKNTLECEIGDFPSDLMKEEMKNIREKLSHDLYESFRVNNIRHNFHLLFMHETAWMHSCFIFMCLSFIVAGALGTFGQSTAACFSLMFAGLIWLICSLYMQFCVYRIKQNIQKWVTLQRGHMRTALREPLNKLLVSRVAAYRHLYTEARKRVSHMEENLLPLQQMHRDINRQVRAFEANIRDL